MKNISLGSVLKNRVPILALADFDGCEIVHVTPEGEEGPDAILAYPEPMGTDRFELWFVVIEGDRIAGRVNSRHVSKVVHDTSDEAAEAAEGAAKAEVLDQFRAKGADGVYLVSTDKLRELAKSPTVPDRVREAAEHELKQRTTVVSIHGKGA